MNVISLSSSRCRSPNVPRLYFRVLSSPNEHDARRVRIDLDRATVGRRRRIHVEAQSRRDTRAAGMLELGSLGERRARPGVEPLEVPIEIPFARPVARRVLHDQRRIDGNQAVAADVRLDGRGDIVVVLRHTDVKEPPTGVDGGHACLVLLAPREVESDEVHPSTVSLVPRPGP